MEPARFSIRQTRQLITGQAGLVLAGQALARFAQLPQQIDPQFPVRAPVLANGAVIAAAYNLLRLIGQSTLTGNDAPPRHPAKRRRLRTVIQELMCVAAAIAHHARSRLLVFGGHCPALACFQRLHAQWSAEPL